VGVLIIEYSWTDVYKIPTQQESNAQ